MKLSCSAKINNIFLLEMTSNESYTFCALDSASLLFSVRINGALKIASIKSSRLPRFKSWYCPFAEGPEFCPRSVYKQHCVDIFLKKSQRFYGTSRQTFLLNLWYPKSQRCVRTISLKLIFGCQFRCRTRQLTTVIYYEANWLC